MWPKPRDIVSKVGDSPLSLAIFITNLFEQYHSLRSFKHASPNNNNNNNNNNTL